jgi:hypothetical protein
MYEAFDSFIGMHTWHTNHPLDEQRFYKALNNVVWLDEFSPERMASYMRTKLKIPSDDHESHFAKCIDQLCHDAWAIRDFLKCNSVVRE